MATPLRPRIAIPLPAAIDLEYTRRCLPLYIEAVEQSGGDPILVLLDGSAAITARACSGILLPGSLADVSPQRYGAERAPECGLPDPAREAADWTLLDDAQRHGKPVLGICYGLQSINVWHGGTLLQHLTAMPVNHAAGAAVAIAHTAQLVPQSTLATLVDVKEMLQKGGRHRLSVNSSHHQAISMVGEGLRLIAHCPQDGVIEAVESADIAAPFLVAVQWHPERSFTHSAASRALFRSLVAAAAGS